MASKSDILGRGGRKPTKRPAKPRHKKQHDLRGASFHRLAADYRKRANELTCCDPTSIPEGASNDERTRILKEDFVVAVTARVLAEQADIFDAASKREAKLR